MFTLTALHFFLVKSTNITLYNNDTNDFYGVQGYVLYHGQFINGNEWDFSDAMVACRELGKLKDYRESMRVCSDVDML